VGDERRRHHFWRRHRERSPGVVVGAERGAVPRPAVDEAGIMNVQYPLKELKLRAPFVSLATGALTEALCDQLIARIEAEHPAAAPILIGHGREVMMPEVRNNERVLFDDPELAARLF